MSASPDTPMMRQYLDLKAQAPGALLLYRMGDFYELFLEDAIEGAALMELTLTSRNKNDPDPVPMCGVPHHALEGYLKRLVDAGRKVAIAEQAENPAASRAAGKTLVDRQIVRVVTPGMPWDPDGVESRESCFLAALCGRGPVGLALLDLTTGDLRVTELEHPAAAAAELSRVEPRELLLAPELAEDPDLKACLDRVTRTLPDASSFDRPAGQRALCDLLGVSDLLGFGAEGLDPSIGAAGAVLAYARDVARADLRHVRSLRVYAPGGAMVLDETTRRNLEILRPLSGSGRKGTLIHLLDRTATPMGGRLLREWLSAPLVDVDAIRARQDAVESLLPSAPRLAIRDRLKAVADLERLAGKVAQATANARDLVALGASLQVLPGLAEVLHRTPRLREALPVSGALDDLLDDVAADIATWLVEEPPATLGDGGYIRRGASAELDELLDLATEGKGAIARIEERERSRTGINSLKIRHNRVFGYYLEVTQANLDKVPADWFRKQTLANAERYITEELKHFEEKVLGADERRKGLEYALFVALRERVAAAVERLQAAARLLAWLDTLASLAEVAVLGRYCRPVVDASADLDIRGGRHPVVEAMGLEERFVPNDVRLGDGHRLVILTGPNMAGKSTVMRQVALIALMAQAGSFVPAESARIGLCDRVFVRVGASDDLARGRSTFMVEMSETAVILNQATSRSLILLDEIGRGTSTWDGLAIAWAVAEAVHDRLRARALFATHYHELIALGEELPHAANQHIAVSEYGEKVIFLRTLKNGGASRSYGIQCARLAGLPDPVLERARALLTSFERRPRAGAPERQVSLFGARPAAPDPEALRAAVEEARSADPVRALIRATNPDELSPKQAMDLLYRLRDAMTG